MYKFLTPLLLSVLLFFTGCFDDKKTTQEEADSSDIYNYSVINERPSGWSDDSHGKNAEPNYSIVFPQDKVNRIDITISESKWKALFEVQYYFHELKATKDYNQ